MRLRGYRHPNLVRIIDGGHDEDRNLLFVVMELIEYPALATMVADVPRDRIWDIVAQVARAARFLEDLSLAHRDIKPDNIAIRPDFAHAVLLDLGVLRPFGDAREAPVTDSEQRHFIGTLQYSSPEFLARREEDTREGWRAVTFYQLGAVLHDLLMRRRIFAEHTEPFAALVEAVKRLRPEVSAPDVSSDLVVLAKNCLMKSPAARLQYVTWDSFEPRPEHASQEALVERIRKRIAAEREQVTVGEGDREQLGARDLQMLVNRIRDLVRSQCVATKLFPPMEMAKSTQAGRIAEFVVQFTGGQANALLQDLVFRFRLELDDSEELAVRVGVVAFLVSTYSTLEPVVPAASYKPLFSGAFDDEAFSSAVRLVMLQTLDRAQTALPTSELTLLLGGGA